METVDEVKMIAPLNQSAHSALFTAESDADFAGFTFPIGDLLYSVAWLDIGQEPIIISVPEFGGRYDAILFYRPVESKLGLYRHEGNRWRRRPFRGGASRLGGRPSRGCYALEVSTPQVNAFIRTFVDGPDDLNNVDALRR